MDAGDSHIAQELDRRLRLVEGEWRAGHAPPLPRADIVALMAIIVIAALVGAIAGVIR